MQTLEALRRKIKSAQDLMGVVRTMKALAAASIRQYERAVESLDHYNRTVLLGLQVALRNRPERLSRKSEYPALGAVVFGSDQGMCGQLNDQIVAHALAEMEKFGPRRNERTVLVVGERAAGRLEDFGQSVEEVFAVPASIAGITPSVQQTLVHLQDWNAKRGIERIVLFYSEQLSGASYRPTTMHLLPLDSEWLARLQAEPWPTKVLPWLTMDWDELFSALVREYLFVSLYRAYAESLASENASRLASMQGAERNVEDHLRGLRAQFHHQRQAGITAELLDITSGFEALRGDH